MSFNLFRIAVVFCFAGLCAFAQPAQERPNWLNSSEVLNYPLTMDKVDRWAAATRGVIIYTKAHPEIAAKIKDLKDAVFESVDAMVAFAKQRAGEYVAIVESNGVPFREYLVISGAVLMSKVVTEKDLWPQVPVNPANVAFMKANKAKLDGILNDYLKLAKGKS